MWNQCTVNSLMKKIRFHGSSDFVFSTLWIALFSPPIMSGKIAKKIDIFKNNNLRHNDYLSENTMTLQSTWNKTKKNELLNGAAIEWWSRQLNIWCLFPNLDPLSFLNDLKNSEKSIIILVQFTHNFFCFADFLIDCKWSNEWSELL